MELPGNKEVAMLQPHGDTPSFGRACIESNITRPEELLAAEKRSGRAERFSEIDALIGRLLERQLAGDPLVTISGAERSNRRVTFTDLSASDRLVLDETWSVSVLNNHGVWFLPEYATLHVGVIHLPWLLTRRGPYAGTLVDEERYRATLAETADAVLLWAVFEPLCQTLFLPFLLRGSQEGTHTPDEARALWATVDRVYSALGLGVDAELGVMRYGGGWSKLHAADRRAAKLALLQALARQARPELAACLRALQLQTLLAQYYTKAKNGRALRRQVLSKACQPIFVTYFGGDWLAFLEYLGEQPHPDEEIVTALPEPRLFVGKVARVQQVAADLGLPVAEVAEVASSLWSPGAALSPIEERTRILDQFWSIFDAIHARQASGMPSLWGLVDDEGAGPLVLRALADTAPAAVRGLATPVDAYRPRLYQTLFPADLLNAIQRLWGTALLPKYPEQIVGEPYAHAVLADTIGPALRFWNGCALTAWFLCEGPYSRTDMAGLAAYHARQLVALDALGTPIHPSLFDELIAAEAHLGPPERVVMAQDTHPVTAGPFSLTVTTYTNGRRPGFERLRDIIARHRQGWSRVYWQTYLHARWEQELRAANQWFSTAVARDGRPPAVRQFAKAAFAPVSHWFGGDISLLYAAIGETSPIQPTIAAPRLPVDPVALAAATLRELYAIFPQIALAAGSIKSQRNELGTGSQGLVITCDRLAEQSLSYAQLWEALDRPPNLKEFGTAKLRAGAETLAIPVETLWESFSSCAQRAILAYTPARMRRDTDI